MDRSSSGTVVRILHAVLADNHFQARSNLVIVRVRPWSALTSLINSTLYLAKKLARMDGPVLTERDINNCQSLNSDLAGQGRI